MSTELSGGTNGGRGLATAPKIGPLYGIAAFAAEAELALLKLPSGAVCAILLNIECRLTGFLATGETGTFVLSS